MDEITGPVLAITLVLSSVFVPCCFLGGVSGQFFRQFAVTISVSTIISAVNALTMTPSRAVLIFRTEEGQGHVPHHEALPWWIFGLIGGIATYYLGPEFLAGRWDLGTALGGENGALPPWLLWTVVSTAYFIPGAVVGGVAGRFLIRPVNALLGLLFRGFNRWFETMTAVYGRTVGRTLRLSAVVMATYAGLLGMTYWQFHRVATGFIPQQDKGYLLLNVQLPDSASVERTERVMAHIGSLARDPGSRAHGWCRRAVVDPERQRAQSGFDVRLARAV